MTDMIAVEAMKLITENQDLVLLEGLTSEDIMPDPTGDFVVDAGEVIYIGNIDSTSVRYSMKSTYATIAKHAYMLAHEMMIQSEIYNQ